MRPFFPLNFQVDAYDPPIRFHQFEYHWYANEDRKIFYEIATNAGRLLDPYDWIGLYEKNFSSIEDYKGYVWSAPNARMTSESKEVWIPDSLVNLPGEFVLVYITKNWSVMGISEPFKVV